MKSIEEEYTDWVGIDHRRRFAQFFTHPRIARFMVEWVLAGRGQKTIHDPAFGLGAFFEAAPSDCLFTGSDVDGKVLDFFSSHSLRMPTKIDHADYLLDFGRQYGNIVCNPPYLRFQKFMDRDAVFAAFCTHLGVRLSGYTNIASAFLMKSLSELGPSGRLAYIMPSEFLNSGYGKAVKTRLVQNSHLDSIIEIECEREAFGEVTTSICIVLYDSGIAHRTVAFRKIVALEELSSVMERRPVSAVPLALLNPSDKWNRYFNPQDHHLRPAMCHLAKISDYGRFSRGIATGANDFFVLSMSDIEHNGLSPNACTPCISKSQQLDGPIFTDVDFWHLANSGARVFLFAPGENPDRASLDYIRKGEAQKYDQGYITRHRMPWYKTEVREASPILVNVFSRSGYKVVRNYSSALSLTNFHCFFPRPLCEKYIDWLFLYLKSDAGRRLLSLSKRKYGNALDKFEPNDLNDALAPSPEFFDSLGESRLISIMSEVRAGRDFSRTIDSIFAPLLDDAHEDNAGYKEYTERSERLFSSDCEHYSGQLLFAMEGNPTTDAKSGNEHESS